MRVRSSIARRASERVVERYPSGAPRRAEYWLDGERVGRRSFYETGAPESEIPERGGRTHGVFYDWFGPGELCSAATYRNGREHGLSRQWHDGKLIGAYRMVHGTGLDLWWGFSDGVITLAEARYCRDGDRHGFEWWLVDDQRSVYIESHFQDGLDHGIERRWNLAGRLRRGYPRYWIRGERTDKRRYITATRSDPTLPPFRARDNKPRRTFPPDVAAALGPRSLAAHTRWLRRQ